MIEYRNGNLLDQDDIEAFLHQCNCFCNFGAGIAKEIKRRYPEAYEADLRTTKGDPDKLGTYTEETCHDGRIVVNLYGQYTYGCAPDSTKPHTDYSSLKHAIEEFIKDYSSSKKLTGDPMVIGMPYKIGCGLGGGDWNVVETMIKELFENNDDFRLIICKL